MLLGLFIPLIIRLAIGGKGEIVAVPATVKLCTLRAHIEIGCYSSH